MTPERLAEIKAWAEHLELGGHSDSAVRTGAVASDLVAEVERLRRALAVYAEPGNWRPSDTDALNPWRRWEWCAGYVESGPPPYAAAREALGPDG